MPIVGLQFMRHNSVVMDTTHSLILFPHLTKQVRSGAIKIGSKPQSVLNDDTLKIPPSTTKIVKPFVDHPSELNTTGTVTRFDTFNGTASLLISHSLSTISDKKVAVRVTNTTESHYLIKTNTRNDEFSVVNPEQSKFIKPLGMAILSTSPEDDLDLTTCLNELLGTNEPG